MLDLAMASAKATLSTSTRCFAASGTASVLVSVVVSALVSGTCVMVAMAGQPEYAMETGREFDKTQRSGD